MWLAFVLDIQQCIGYTIYIHIYINEIKNIYTDVWSGLASDYMVLHDRATVSVML